MESEIITELDSLNLSESAKEFVENTKKRKNFPWPEAVKAKAEIHRALQEKHGTAIKGHGGGWSLKDTAHFLGESVGLTSRDIRIAEGLREYPELAKEKNKETAWRKLKKMEKRTIPPEEKCILCGNKTGRRQVDNDVFFDKTLHAEYNINVVVTDNVTYITTRSNKGYENSWHIDGCLGIEDLTAKLEKAVEKVL